MKRVVGTCALLFSLIFCTASALDQNKVYNAVLSKLNNDNENDGIRYLSVESSQYNIESAQSAALFLDVKAECRPEPCPDNFKCFARVYVDENGEQFEIEQAHCLVNQPHEIVDEFVPNPEQNTCCGMEESIDTNVPGLELLLDGALRQLEGAKSRRHALIKIVDLKRQVVAGVKYILTVEVAPTVCNSGEDLSKACPIEQNSDSFVCRVEFIEQKWISDEKRIISNNCTGYNYYDEPEISSTSTTTTNKPKQNNDNISVERLSELESQIVLDQQEPINEQTNTETTQKQQNQEELLLNNNNNNQKQTNVEEIIEPVQNYTDTIAQESELLVNPITEQISKQEIVQVNSKPENTNPETVSQNINNDNVQLQTETKQIQDFEQRAEINEPIVTKQQKPLNINNQRTNPEQFDPIIEAILRQQQQQEVDQTNPESMDYLPKTEQIDIPEEPSFGEPEYIRQEVERNLNGKIFGQGPDFPYNNPHLRHMMYEEIAENSNLYVPMVPYMDPMAMDYFSANVDGYRRILDNNVEDDINNSDNEERTLYKRSTDQLKLKGAPKEQPLDHPQALEYIKSSLSQLDADSGLDNKLKLRKILKVTSQVVAGSKWVIQAEVISSDCAKNEAKSAEDCNELQNGEVRVCDFVIWDRPWIKKNGREIEVECDNNKGQKHTYRSKRSADEDFVLGGLTKVPPNSPEALEYAKHSLSLFDSDSGHSNKLIIKKILSATSQVVAGSKWIIKAEVVPSNCPKTKTENSDECTELDGENSQICTFEIWDRSWIKNGRQTTVKCANNVKEYEYRSKRSLTNEQLTNKRSKRGIPGGINEKPTNSSEAWTFVKDALKQADSDSEHANRLKIRKIISVTSQVVAGLKWTIRAEIVVSDCAKTSDKLIEECGEDKEPKVQTCQFIVWDRPWLKNGRETTVKCDNEAKEVTYRSKRDVANADLTHPRTKRHLSEPYQIPTTLNNNNNKPNLEVYDYIQTTLEYLDRKSTYENSYALKDILKVLKYNEDFGKIWKIKVKIVLSDCLKQNKDAKYCQPLDLQEYKICNITVLEQPVAGNSMEQDIVLKCQEDPNVYKLTHKINKNNKNKNYNQILTDLHIVKQFKQFIQTYERQYKSTHEYNQKFIAFKDNLKTIQLLNQQEQGTAIYGITQFADWTADEFSKLNGYKSQLRSENDIPFKQAKIPNINLPKEFDWRSKNVVTTVKNQGQCGSCWAFSVTGNVEGQYAIKTGKLLEFSEQELVDCDKTDQGCNGGLMDNAYRVIEQLGGLEQEQDYPYEAEDDKCQFNKAKVSVQLSGAVNISSNEVDMAKWLVKNGPISIAINANAMQFYVGGVSHPWKFLCNPKNLDHGVLIVGYGVHNYPMFNKTMPYWTVKNSWGESWGEQGYYRVYRGDGTCGVNQTPSSAIVAQ